IRPTNVTIVAGLALAVVLVPPRNGLIGAGMGLVAGAVGFAIPVAIQLASNRAHLGSALASGYGFWVPEVYGASGRTFSPEFLFGPTLPRNPHGNVPIYVSALLGLDGLLGDRGDLRFFLYPFAAAVFAAIGIGDAVRSKANPVARRVMLFGVGYLAALVA